MIDYSDIEQIIEKCYNELSTASRDKYDSEAAEKTASLFLLAQMKISFFIEDIEIKAKGAKNEISRVEGEKYFIYKDQNPEKKMTENMLTSHIAKDEDVISAKNESAKYESILKKWNYVLGTLKDGHIYFRNIGKNKTWSE